MPSSHLHPLQKAARALVRHILSPRPTAKNNGSNKLARLDSAKGKRSTQTLTPRSRYIPLRIRYLVLKRDHSRCQHCGLTSEETELQVDHIIPFSRGGSNDITNLQTLCRDCNLGKGNRP